MSTVESHRKSRKEPGALEGRVSTRKFAPEFLERRFKKGESGNPNGNKGTSYGDVIRTARKYSSEAMLRLVELMRSDDERVAFLASQALLDRAFGKTPENTEVAFERHHDERSRSLELRSWLIARLNQEAQGQLPPLPSSVSDS